MIHTANAEDYSSSELDLHLIFVFVKFSLVGNRFNHKAQTIRSWPIMKK